MGANTRLTWIAISQVNQPPALFRFGDETVWVDSDGTIRIVTPSVLGRFATDRIDFFKQRGNQRTTPAERLFKNMLSGPTVLLPELRGAISIPVFGPNGTLQDTPGYLEDTKLYYAPPKDFEVMCPDPAVREEAREYLLSEILSDFPFDGPASRAHAVGALLLPFVRSMIEGPTPLHLISKPKAGTGATLLAEVLAYPGAGMPRVITLSGTEDELRRTLFSGLRDGPGAMLLDNVTKLEGASLASVLTQTTMTDRVVGSSRVATAPNRSLWLATSNNPTMSDEIARRTVRIHLDAKTEHPELRNGFRTPDLRRWIVNYRRDLVWYALSLVQAWITSGRPAGTNVLGRFEDWAKVIGGILDVAGIPGFLGNFGQFRCKGDLEYLDMLAFVEAWARDSQKSEVHVQELLPLAGSLNLGSGTEHSRLVRLGLLLHARTDQYFGKLVIRRGGKVNGYNLWRLEETP
jgi:putative DNA primase/helicase